ncbi:site-2 protease family protein [Thalassiella azotivora]
MSAAPDRSPPSLRHPEGWQVATLLGVPVVLARSWLVIAAVVTVLFGPLVRDQEPGLGAAAWFVALGYAVLLLLSVLLHELGHAAVARATGTPATRIVLNLWGGHTQFETEATTPGRSMAVAAVGPAANGVIAVVAYLALGLVDGGVPGLLLGALALTNGFVAVFNLVPGLPLDGGRVLEALVWKATGDRATGMVVAGWAGRVVAVGLVIGLVVVPLARGGAPGLLTVVWTAMIGGLLWQGAGEAVRAAGVRRRLGRADLAHLADPAVGVPSQVTLAEAGRRAVAAGARDVVLLDPQGRPVAVVDAEAAGAVPPQRREEVPVASTARALPPGPLLPADLSGAALLDAVSRSAGEEWVVVGATGEVTGVLRAAALVAVLLPRSGR